METSKLGVKFGRALQITRENSNNFFYSHEIRDVPITSQPLSIRSVNYLSLRTSSRHSLNCYG